MLSIPSGSNRTCKRCRGDLEAGALACRQCHALVHEEDLQRLAAEAKSLEAQGEPRQAREQWLKALELLPQDSTQAEWVRGRSRRLHLAAGAPTHGAEKKWLRKLGPLAPVAVALAKSKALLAVFNLKFLLSLAAFAGLYWSLYGLKFGIGFAALILIHEMGHVADIKRRGLPADMPIFLPGLGAYVRWQALGVSAETRAAVSLAGPLAGCMAAAACGLLWWTTGGGIWAALARTSAWLNVINLIPIWVLDGGQAMMAMSKGERLAILTTAMAVWLLMGQRVFFLVVLGAGYRLFTKDDPPHPSPATTVYFAALLISLGVVLRMLPLAGFGAN